LLLHGAWRMLACCRGGNACPWRKCLQRLQRRRLLLLVGKALCGGAVLRAKTIWWRRHARLLLLLLHCLRNGWR
jgi:hypothetical protein